jgi:hypothetical protein
MKISIKLEYRDKIYTSDYAEMTEEEYKQMTDLIEKIVEGKVTYFTFKKDNQNFYFGQKILEESIVTVSNAT